MNVIYFDIVVKRNKLEKIPIEDIIIMSYINDSANSEEWNRQIESFWTDFPHKNLKAIYSYNTPIVIANTENNQYCLFKSNSSTSKVAVTLQLLVISNTEDINDAINKVLKDIKRVLNWKCIIGKVFRNSVKVDRKNSVYVYPFNSETNDIWDTTYKIKASFNRVIYEKGEKLQLSLISIISVILAVLYFFSNISEQNKSIMFAIFSSGIFFCLTTLAAKMERIFLKRYNITINNLSNFLEKGLALPFNINIRPNLQNPKIPKNVNAEMALTIDEDGDNK